MAEPDHAQGMQLPDPASVAARRFPYWALCCALVSTLVLLMVVIAGLGRDHGGERARPPEVPTTALVVAWSARMELGDGALLDARLSALHAEPERQRFEAVALQRRLGLPEGEPWRLDLRWSSSSSKAPPLAEHLPWRELCIVDALGEVAKTLSFDTKPKALGEAYDPVAVLFSPPLEPLEPGKSVSLVLWGRAPGEGVAIAGWPSLEQSWQLERNEVAATAQTPSLVVVARSETSGSEPSVSTSTGE